MSSTIQKDVLYSWGKNSVLGASGTPLGTSDSASAQLTTPTKAVANCLMFNAHHQSEHSLILKNNSTLFSAGNNSSGQLGLGNTTNTSTFTQVGSLTTWSKIYGGYNCSFAINTDGTLWAWGSNFSGQLGNNDTNIFPNSPIQIGGDSNWSQVSNGGTNWTAAIKTNGSLYSWGYNSYGQLGKNNTTIYSSPVQVGTDTTWSKISCSYEHAVAIKTNGTLWSWGSNFYGELGTGDAKFYSSPVQVGLLTNWSKIECGGLQMNVAIKTDGTLWAWGRNIYGGLGTGNTTDYNSPIQIGLLTNWADVSCGAGHTIALKTNGELWAWGLNDQGQLGLGDTNNRSSPVQVGVSSKWTKIYRQGQYFSMGIASSTI